MMMPEKPVAILGDPVVRAALQQAWRESQPGPTGGHEEGGFILREPTSRLWVLRWPRGNQNSIDLPAHPGCTVSGSDIIMTFHTHPNTGPDYLQEPSETDKRAVRDDPDLKSAFYLGELVVSKERIYLIEPTGHVVEIGETHVSLLC
jgi:hypothetical protein